MKKVRISPRFEVIEFPSGCTYMRKIGRTFYRFFVGEGVILVTAPLAPTNLVMRHVIGREKVEDK